MEHFSLKESDFNARGNISKYLLYYKSFIEIKYFKGIFDNIQ